VAKPGVLREGRTELKLRIPLLIIAKIRIAAQRRDAPST
jgi:hypothetical protein